MVILAVSSKSACPVFHPTFQFRLEKTPPANNLSNPSRRAMELLFLEQVTIHLTALSSSLADITQAMVIPSSRRLQLVQLPR